MIVDPATVKLGKLPAAIPSRLMMMRDHFVAPLPDPPATCHWSGVIRDWGMMANDNLGDCTCAGVGHAYQVWTLNGHGIEWTAPDDKIIDLYEKATGYNPSDPNSDQGGECSAVLSYITKNTFCGWTIDGFTLVDHKDARAVRQGIWMLGGLYLGIGLPLTAKTQDVWDVVPNAGSSGEFNSWGGHCVHAVNYDEEGVTVITWGKLQKMTWAFWAAYVDESYAVLANAWVMSGKSPPGFNKQSLHDNMKELHV